MEKNMPEQKIKSKFLALLEKAMPVVQQKIIALHKAHNKKPIIADKLPLPLAGEGGVRD